MSSTRVDEKGEKTCGETLLTGTKFKMPHVQISFIRINDGRRGGVYRLLHKAWGLEKRRWQL